jgi:hypothetical protein
MRNLTKVEIRALIQKVFAPQTDDRRLVILLDVPNQQVGDHDKWRDRRQLAVEWKAMLDEIKTGIDIAEIELFYYENVGSNNAELPSQVFRWPGDPRLVDIQRLKSEGTVAELKSCLAESDIILAPTEFSTTAPLKLLAKQYRFRAATMPGFSRDMIPALSVDYDLVHQQVMQLKNRLDGAIGIEILLQAEGKDCPLFVDLRYRAAHASSGLLHERGVAGNLPSGEAYIVPYEGERKEASRTEGQVPVQFGDEVVFYKIQNNRATEVFSKGAASKMEIQKLRDEPAYGNIAEIGFGVLARFGVKPVGETLLDEKLGLHIAFGRSDHFGGAISPRDFKNPKNVIHIDRIYIPEVQPKVQVKEVVFRYPEQRQECVIRNGIYII